MKKIIYALLFLIFAHLPAQATNISFDAWVQNFRGEALRAGISQKTINDTLTGLQPIQKVIDLDRKQPEAKKTFAEYKKNIVNQQRIDRGRQLLSDYAQTLSTVERQYGVPKEFIVALWGIETNYGTNTGGFKIIPALATLAWEGRRAAFFKEELLKALRIVDEGHISASEMKGSWAGAMGQNQFMPSSFFNFAVDHNGDGHKDIWGTRGDVFASTANYLASSGWKSGQRWGRHVMLPNGFPAYFIKDKTKKPLNEWAKMGLRDLSGGPLPDDSMTAQVVAPDGVAGETYLVYDNYQVIMAWNRSTYFATSVGLLADALSR